MVKWNGWVMPKMMHKYIVDNLEEGKTILEFGSGYATGLLLKKYNVISVEHDKEFIKPRPGKYNHTVIHAPIVVCKVKGWVKKEWYDFKIIKKALKGVQYDAIIIDGPTGKYGRAGILKYVKRLDMCVMIVMDDLQSVDYSRIFVRLTKDRPFTIIKDETSNNRVFGVIYEIR